MFESICFSITNLCNMQCKYCFRLSSRTDCISLEDFEKCLKRLKLIGTSIITITGGEPLLHPNWRRCIELCNEYGYLTNYSSNTLLLDLDDPVFSNLNILTISNDGYLSTTGQGRTEEQFKKSRAVIDQYVRGDYPFKLKVNTVLTKNNLRHLPDFAKETMQSSKLIWMIFPYCNWGEYNTLPKTIRPSDAECEKLFSELESLNLECKLMTQYSRKLLNSYDYIVLNADGELVEERTGHINRIGNLLEDEERIISAYVELLENKEKFEDYTGAQGAVAPMARE